MTAKFEAHLKIPGAQASAVGVAAFALQEGYSTGWGGTATVVALPRSGSMTAGAMFGALAARGVRAGRSVSVSLLLARGGLSRGTVRTWPCVVDSLQPYQLTASAAACNVHLLDPVSFLAEQPIWGAYRSVSVGEIVGGALSLAAGGDGKPTLSPLLPGLPAVRIAEGYREELATVPHAIAAGQTLGDWLAEFLALLGLRAELSISDGGESLVLELLDSVPRRQPLEMTVVSPDDEVDRAGTSGGTSSTIGPDSDSQIGIGPDRPGGDLNLDGGIGPDRPGGDLNLDGGSELTDPSRKQPSDDGGILITGHAGFPGTPRRGGLLDDPTMGSARVVYAYGAIGAVLTGPDLDVEEAGSRIHRSLLGTYAEMLMVSAISGQPRVRIGDRVTLSRPVHRLESWQVAGVRHKLDGGVYDNDLTLLRGDIAWHPELPLYHPPVYVTGVVDGGIDFQVHEPVPRDRLGRIKVSFPFTPTPVGQEAAEIAAADTTGDSGVRDGRVRMEDFSEEQIKSYTDGMEEWDEKAAKYEAGEFADPYPRMSDDELSTEEKANRDALRASRKEALAYMAYRKATGDRDHDGVISDRDTVISDELSGKLKGRSGREWMQTLWNMGPERRERYLAERLARKVLADDYNRFGGNLKPEEVSQAAVDEVVDNRSADGSPIQSAFDAREAKEIDTIEELVQEYGELFEVKQDGLSGEVLDARQDVEETTDRWPPRIPLSVVTPMAGAMHGFISAHRHGDICRVAVHNPLSAEIVGFQYRDDRKINVDLVEAVAGFVVEHDHSQAWSGLVFRRNDPPREVDDADSGTDDELETDETKTELETDETKTELETDETKTGLEIEPEPVSTREIRL